MKTTKGRACRSAPLGVPPFQTYPQATEVTSFRILLNFSNPKGAFRNPSSFLSSSFLSTSSLVPFSWASRSRLEANNNQIFLICWASGRASKNHPKGPKSKDKSNLGSSCRHLGPRNMTFEVPFAIDFSAFFQMAWNQEKYLLFNTFQWFGPSKNIDVPIVVS